MYACARRTSFFEKTNVNRVNEHNHPKDNTYQSTITHALLLSFTPFHTLIITGSFAFWWGSAQLLQFLQQLLWDSVCGICRIKEKPLDFRGI